MLNTYQNSVFLPIHIPGANKWEVITPLLVLFLLVMLAVKYVSLKLTRFSNKEKTKQIFDISKLPGPSPSWIPFLGNARQLLPVQNSLKVALKWSVEYGSCFRAGVAGQTFVWLNSPSAVQSLMKSSDMGHLHKAPFVYDLLSPFITNGVLVSKGLFWKSQRSLLMRCLSYQTLRSYMPLLNRHAHRLVDTFGSMFQDDKLHTINESVNVTFLEIMCELITAVDIHDTEEGAQFHRNLQRWKESVAHRLLNPWLLLNTLWKLHPKSWQQSDAANSMNCYTLKLIENHKTRRVQTSYVKKEGQYTCILDDLLDEGVTDPQIVDELNVMLIAGHETSSTAVHMFCFLIALNPDCQTKCQEEIDQLWEREECAREGLSFDALNHLKYLECCIKETLRLFPSIFSFSRQLNTPLVVEDGMELPAGTNVFVCPWTMHRNPEYWPNPDAFDPQRFSCDAEAKIGAYTYLPFSSGRRNCFGFKFAMMQMKTTLVHILREFRLTTVDKMEDVAILPNIILTPERDYHFRLERRHKFVQ